MGRRRIFTRRPSDGLADGAIAPRRSGPRGTLSRRHAPSSILLTLYTLENYAPPGKSSDEAVTKTEVVDKTEVITRPATTVVTGAKQPYQAITTTTVTYTIVDPYDPSCLTTTEYCATLTYQPCKDCAYQPIPTVAMTTYKVPCNACGFHGEDEVTIAAPYDALPTEKSSHKVLTYDGPIHEGAGYLNPAGKTVNPVQAKPTSSSEADGYYDESNNANDYDYPHESASQHLEKGDVQDTYATTGHKQDGYPDKQSTPTKYPGSEYNDAENPPAQSSGIQRVTSPAAPARENAPSYTPVTPKVGVAAAGRLHFNETSFLILTIVSLLFLFCYH